MNELRIEEVPMEVQLVCAGCMDDPPVEGTIWCAECARINELLAESWRKYTAMKREQVETPKVEPVSEFAEDRELGVKAAWSPVLSGGLHALEISMVVFAVPYALWLIVKLVLWVVK